MGLTWECTNRSSTKLQALSLSLSFFLSFFLSFSYSVFFLLAILRSLLIFSNNMLYRAVQPPSRVMAWAVILRAMSLMRNSVTPTSSSTDMNTPTQEILINEEEWRKPLEEWKNGERIRRLSTQHTLWHWLEHNLRYHLLLSDTVLLSLCKEARWGLSSKENMI